MRALYKFEIDFGRMGVLSGTFVAHQNDIDRLMGKDVYFGEVLGKHSDVYETMEPGFFTLVTSEANDPDFITKFEEYDLSTGINPPEFVNDDFWD